MSYDIELVDPVTRQVLKSDVPHLIRGGTYAIGGSLEYSLNITYNYGEHFRRVLGDKGIRCIYGMTAAESIPVLMNAISVLADDVHDDYWEPTEGNAKRALCSLLSLAQLRPDGVWAGD